MINPEIVRTWLDAHAKHIVKIEEHMDGSFFATFPFGRSLSYEKSLRTVMVNGVKQNNLADVNTNQLISNAVELFSLSDLQDERENGAYYIVPHHESMIVAPLDNRCISVFSDYQDFLDDNELDVLIVPDNMSIKEFIKMRYNTVVAPPTVDVAYAKAAQAQEAPKVDAVIIEDGNTFQAVKLASVHGVKLAVADQMAELVLDIGLSLFSPLLVEFISDDAREFLKFMFAVGICYLIEKFETFRNYIGEERCILVQNACGFVIQAAAKNYIQPRLATLREQLELLAKIDKSILKEEVKSIIGEDVDAEIYDKIIPKVATKEEQHTVAYSEEEQHISIG